MDDNHALDGAMADLVVDFLEAAVNSLLHARRVYPQGWLCRFFPFANIYDSCTEGRDADEGKYLKIQISKYFALPYRNTAEIQLYGPVRPDDAGHRILVYSCGAP